MSSLYGSGQSQIPVLQGTTTAASSFTGSTVEKTADISDKQAMEAYLRQQFADEPILVDIARCESEFQQFDKNGNLIHGRIDPRDIGVMQINEYYQGPTAEKLGFDLTTLDGNVAYAKHLYEEQGTKPWNSSSKCWMQSGDVAQN